LEHTRGLSPCYDNLNRLNSASGLYGSQSYTYDGVGNRLTRVIGSTTDTYAYSSSANQISTVTTGSNVRTFSYLASGQVSDDVRNPSNDYAFTYNDNGRSITAKLNGSTVGSYTYNAFEQRVQKVAGGVTTQFVFDRFGHLLEEANSSGVVQKEYIWLDDLPMAMVDDTGAPPVLYFIHTDQLGTPQKITDGSANVVWDGVYDPFGIGVSISSLWGSPTQWGNFNWGSTTSVSTNLRFPGQYADAETALNQNWNRDYGPTIGRYVQSDPVGLLGGMNTYEYVNGNPLRSIDPYGFWYCAPGVNCDLTQPTQDAMTCMDTCLGSDLTVTGGRGNRTRPNSSHARGEACDIGRGANPDLSRSDAQRCFLQCFPNGYGQEEQNANGGTHFHFQLNHLPGARPNFSPIVRPYTP
jgi:RHS repeat-associated protein